MQIQVSLIVDIDANADLTSMEHTLQEAGQQAMRHGLQQAVRQWEQQHRRCPFCGSQQGRLEGASARTIHTLFGMVRVPR